MEDTYRIYIIELGSEKALNECEAVEISTTDEIIEWVDENFYSDMDYFKWELQWRWVEIVENEMYACVIEYFDGGDWESIEESLDCVSDIVAKV